MKLKIFYEDMLLPCALLKDESLVYFRRYDKNGNSVTRATRVKKMIRQMLKIEKLSQKWSFVHEDEEYLYYVLEGVFYGFDKRYWEV